jgi:C4-dicarboxylate-specific signal transduction histidine kinase
MSTGLAHELNQPLSAIVNFASGCVRRLQSSKGAEPEIIDAMA